MDQLEALLNVWVQHFGKLAKSKLNDSDGVQDLSCASIARVVVGIQYSCSLVPRLFFDERPGYQASTLGQLSKVLSS